MVQLRSGRLINPRVRGKIAIVVVKLRPRRVVVIDWTTGRSIELEHDISSVCSIVLNMN